MVDDLRSEFFGILYVLDKGIVLKDGDTIGASEEEKIEISHVPSFCDDKCTVVRLGM